MQGYCEDHRRQRRQGNWQGQHGHALFIRQVHSLASEHQQFPAPRTHFLQVGEQFFQQGIVRRQRHHRHVLAHQSQGAVLEFAGRIALGVDVGDFLELEGAFQGDRVFHPTPQEQGVFAMHQERGQSGDSRFQGQHTLHLLGQAAQIGHDAGDFLRRQRLGLADAEGEQHQRHQLGGESLGGGNPDFHPGAGHQHAIRFPHQRAFRHVADGQTRQVGPLPTGPQCGQGIGGLARLGQGDEQGIGGHGRLAIAEFTGDFRHRRNAGQGLDPVARHQRGVIAGTTSHQMDRAHLAEQRFGIRAEHLRQHPIRRQPAFQGFGQHPGLFVDLLEHEMAIGAAVEGFIGQAGTEQGTLHGLA